MSLFKSKNNEDVDAEEEAAAPVPDEQDPVAMVDDEEEGDTVEEADSETEADAATEIEAEADAEADAGDEGSDSPEADEDDDGAGDADVQEDASDEEPSDDDPSDEEPSDEAVADADDEADGSDEPDKLAEPAESAEDAEVAKKRSSDGPAHAASSGKHAATGEPGFVAAKFDEIPSKKRRGGLKVAGITLGVLVAVVLVAYVAGAVVFMGRALPNTFLGEYDISMKTDAEVTDMLDRLVADYQLDVIGSNGFSYRATGQDVGLSIDADDVVGKIHQDLNAWQWPVLIAQQSHDESDALVVKFKPTEYEEALSAAIDQFNATATPPVNATIVYDEAADKFQVKPEELGTQINPQAVLEKTASAIGGLEYKLQLQDEDLVQPTVFSTDEKLIEAAELATGMISARLTLVMGGQNVGEVNGDSLSEFITMDDAYQIVFREDEMNEWVENLAYSFDTVGTERHYTRADGKQVSVPAGGVYGWEVDSEALKTAIVDGIRAGSVAQIDVPCISEAQTYIGPNQRDWGNRYIDVDLTEQHVRFYGDDGSIIWESDCISGKPDGTHNTVPGTWYVNNKESPSKLIGYENGKKIYETTVQYWMAFEYNGIGFHDATWQPSFGGTMYADGYGSHGCVNLSYNAAESLYSIIQIGDVVTVHY